MPRPLTVEGEAVLRGVAERLPREERLLLLDALDEIHQRRGKQDKEGAGTEHDRLVRELRATISGPAAECARLSRELDDQDDLVRAVHLRLRQLENSPRADT